MLLVLGLRLELRGAQALVLEVGCTCESSGAVLNWSMPAEFLIWCIRVLRGIRSLKSSLVFLVYSKVWEPWCCREICHGSATFKMKGVVPYKPRKKSINASLHFPSSQRTLISQPLFHYFLTSCEEGIFSHEKQIQQSDPYRAETWIRFYFFIPNLLVFSEADGESPGLFVRSQTWQLSWVSHWNSHFSYVPSPSPMHIMPRSPSRAVCPDSSPVSHWGQRMSALLCPPLLQLSNSRLRCPVSLWQV